MVQQFATATGLPVDTGNEMDREILNPPLDTTGIATLLEVNGWLTHLTSLTSPGWLALLAGF